MANCSPIKALGLVVLTIVAIATLLLSDTTLLQFEKNEETIFEKENSLRKSNSKTTKPRKSNDFSKQHKQCSLEGILKPPKDQETMKRRLPLWKVGQYIPSNPLVDKPRYDHMTCPAMKARYNCALPESEKKKFGGNATDWKLVLQTNPGEEVCDLPAWTRDVGGPAGVASEIQGRLTETKQRPLNFVFHGNSFLRQMWEALVCGWQGQITDMIVQKGGVGFSVQALEKRGIPISNTLTVPQHRTLGTTADLFKVDEIGELFNPQVKGKHMKGCHGVSDEQLPEYYHPNVSLPPDSISGCNDNIAMVEFESKIRFIYIFRPSIYESLEKLYSKVQLRFEDIDGLIFNDLEDEMYPTEKLQDGVWNRSVIWDGYFHSFRGIQERYTNQWYGAVNPWIIRKPDGHPCMPGVPDDEVNLLLLLLFSDVR